MVTAVSTNQILQGSRNDSIVTNSKIESQEPSKQTNTFSKIADLFSKTFQSIWNRAVVYVGRSDLQYADVKLNRLKEELFQVPKKKPGLVLGHFAKLLEVKTDRTMSDAKINAFVLDIFNGLPKRFKTAIYHRLWASQGRPIDQGSDFGKELLMSNPRSQKVINAIRYLQGSILGQNEANRLEIKKDPKDCEIGRYFQTSLFVALIENKNPMAKSFTSLFVGESSHFSKEDNAVVAWLKGLASGLDITRDHETRSKMREEAEELKKQFEKLSMMLKWEGNKEYLIKTIDSLPDYAVAENAIRFSRSKKSPIIIQIENTREQKQDQQVYRELFSQKKCVKFRDDRLESVRIIPARA